MVHPGTLLVSTDLHCLIVLEGVVIRGLVLEYEGS